MGNVMFENPDTEIKIAPIRSNSKYLRREWQLSSDSTASMLAAAPGVYRPISLVFEKYNY